MARTKRYHPPQRLQLLACSIISINGGIAPPKEISAMWPDKPVIIRHFSGEVG
jgi:hypothetical protein